MIKVTRLNNKEVYVNPDLIETLESTPDTVITLTTGHKIIALESIDELIDRIVQYKRKLSILPAFKDSNPK